RSNSHAQAQREEHEQALGLSADVFGRYLVGVNLARDEEEIVADAVQHDTPDDHPADFVGSAQREERVTHNPCQHSNSQHPLHAKSHEKEGHHDHEDNFGHLPERHHQTDDIAKAEAGRNISEAGHLLKL